MLNLKSFTVASAALTLFSGVTASGLYPVKRNEEPAQPSCTDFTPFKYAGCFIDNGSPRTLLYTGPRNSNQTVQDCVAFCKGNDYQYAGLEYGEECFCGASVNNIQADEADCNMSCTGDDTEICGGFNRVSIYQDPTFPVADSTTISDYQKLGCYSEGSVGRSLAWRQDQVSGTTMTVEKCLTACKAGGFSFTGIEFASECYCGVVLGNGTLPVDSSNCDMPCNGDSTETCGGRGTLDLYVAKDLESSEPCEGGSSSSSSSTISSTSTSSTSSSTKPPYTTSTTSSSTRSTTCSTSSSTRSTTASTTKPPSSSSTVPTTTTSKTASLCTSTTTIAPTPTCEYKCGNWCSNPLPKFTDKNTCWSAYSSCTVQVASCFLNAGFPESMNCFQFSSWCTSISSYCSSYCPGGNCSKEGCKNKYPPSGPSVPAPSVSTSVYPCPAPTAKPSTTSTTASSTTVVPIPTDTNICKQPHNPGNGYTSSSPVGSIDLPCLTCNNVYNEYKSGYPFKLYTSSQSKNCPSYPRGGNNGPTQACKDACDSQYKSCLNTYAQSCKNSRRNHRRGDSYDSATQKCKNQWYDCYKTNSNVQPGNRCGSWNSGWY
ncbi:WSC domain-containing protein [Leptodontidium sp. MPI-SDFR-AT-0119]|nr:WSC domain-containing protein [Leptodontidium sp. MPI-SDFR-AT-0119]